MTTRRNMIKAGAGLAAILTSQTAPAILVRSMVAARNGIAAAKRGWVNPYVTDGLVAMWDGEWNAGGGVHDPAATEWKNLSGNGNSLTLSGSYNWDVDGLNMAHAYAYTSQLQDLVTAEFGYVDNNTSGIYFIFGNNSQMGVVNRTNGFIKAANSSSAFPIPATPASISYIYNNPILCYTNGSAVSAISQEATSYQMRNIFCIGERYPSFNNYFVGKIMWFRGYSRALTAAEIAANYAVDKARFNLA